jgi:hypothetical protein
MALHRIVISETNRPVLQVAVERAGEILAVLSTGARGGADIVMRILAEDISRQEINRRLAPEVLRRLARMVSGQWRIY